MRRRSDETAVRLQPQLREWLETSFPYEAVLECFPIIMRTMRMEDIVSYEDLIEALPDDADIVETLGLNVYALPDHSMYVPECPNHHSRQEHFLGYLNGMQLVWRIDAKYPEAVASPQLAMLILYTGSQEAKEEKQKYDERERNQEDDR